MKNTLKLISVLTLGACVYGSPVNYEKLYSTDLSKIEWSKVDGRGSSCQTNWFFGLIPLGDNSVAEAVENAEISKLAYVDTDTTVYIPLIMSRNCTNVWGELTPAARAAESYSNKGFDEEYGKITKAPAKISETKTAKSLNEESSKQATAKASTKATGKTPEVKSEVKSDYGMPAAL